jgi:3-hydroxyacyl-[acyl-carrier-protein] dehydratase
MVIPGDKLEIKSELVSERRNFWKFKCTSSVDGKIAAQAEIVCTFIDSNKK